MPPKTTPAEPRSDRRSSPKTTPAKPRSGRHASVPRRRRVVSRGSAELPDRELLATFLGPLPGKLDTGAMAERILASLGGLRGLVTASAETFCGVPGLGPARFARLHAALEIARRALAEEMCHGDVLERPEHVHGFLRLWLLDRGYEVFCALFLDGRNRLIVAEELFRGTLGQTAVYPREVARRALQLNAAAVLVAHNHPSGTAEPSAADEHLTAELRRALALIDVRVLDHFIVAGARVYSFAAHGRL